MIPELAAAAVALGVTASGWAFAFRARGESRDALKQANEAAERSRLAELARDAARAKENDATARVEAAAARLKVAEEKARALEVALGNARRENLELYEQLAKAGAPVGGDLVDVQLSRLHTYPARRETGGDQGPVSGGGNDQGDLPEHDPDASPKSDPHR